MQMRPGARSRRGIALVVVLIVVTILMILVLEFHFNTRVTARIASNVADDLKAYYLAKSGVHVAARFLVEDAEDNRDDDLTEQWAQPLPPIPAGEGYVQVSITDESTMLNINRLVRRSGRTDSRLQRQFEQLLQILGLDLQLVNAFIDWIDEDTSHYVTGAFEDSTYGYNTDEIPYPCKNNPVDTPSEIGLIAGVTPEVYRILSPYLSVYSGRKININTADAAMLRAVILAIDPGADENLADQIIEHRTEDPFSRKSMRRTLENDLGLPKALASGLRRYLVTRSYIFRVTSTALVNQAQKKVTAVIQRSRGRYKILYWRVD